MQIVTYITFFFLFLLSRFSVVSVQGLFTRANNLRLRHYGLGERIVLSTCSTNQRRHQMTKKRSSRPFSLYLFKLRMKICPCLRLAKVCCCCIDLLTRSCVSPQTTPFFPSIRLSFFSHTLREAGLSATSVSHPSHDEIMTSFWAGAACCQIGSASPRH
ncbi:hypothetical protein EDB81DRAFT_249426 [Dactylonectria macrodidyma]|uniref:Uncharacterized protein n=1 Tax=Dactylonectria macrodidyma TaxID=307937 RepID=A0A9P9JFI5_9HYPO|nr:hypothetical protein EDB81DRAFT_249426 [Dactylonectria macrodidyma]